MRRSTGIVIVILAITGCRSSPTDVSPSVSSREQVWRVPPNTLEIKARQKAPEPADPTRVGNSLQDAALPEYYQATDVTPEVRLPTRHLIYRFFESRTGRYMADVARDYLRLDRDLLTRERRRKVVWYPAFNGRSLTFHMRLHW